MTSAGLCTFLEWDTEFFGYRIGRVNRPEISHQDAIQIDEWAQANQIDCLYFLADDRPNTVRVAEDHDYRLHDVRMTLNVNIASHKRSEWVLGKDFEQGIATVDDQDALLPLTYDTFTDSRFYHDPNFTKGQCDKLYEMWLIRSLERSFADIVFKISFQQTACAYITASVDQEQKIGEIGIVGVSAQMRGHSLGVHLIDAILAYCREEGMEQCEVVTQARNIAAQRLYQKCGFRTSSVQLWYHKWYR